MPTLSGTDTAGTDTAAAGAADEARFFDEAFAQWLAEPDVTVACGRWHDGAAIAELVPHGRARLLPARYRDRFSGVRELRIDGCDHHLHIDFGRVHRLAYVIAPSVCLAFKPSFEVRLLLRGPGGVATDQWLVSLMLSAPYQRDRLDEAAAWRWFDQARRQAAQGPRSVSLTIGPSVRDGARGPAILALLRQAAGTPRASWADAERTLIPGPTCAAAGPQSGPQPDPQLDPQPGPQLDPQPDPQSDTAADPRCRPLLERALALADASLVIYRHQLLVEFQTEQLGGLRRYEEQGHVSWQIGDTRRHHCHLSLAAVERVLFSAEPVSCQGGGLNYTVWFLSAGPSGNPWRPDGYFSVVLNRPYQGNAPRRAVIDPVFDLYRAFRDERWVEADPTFLQVLAEGPPRRDGRAAGD